MTDKAYLAGLTHGFLIAVIVMLCAACENPVEHFTEPPEVIDHEICPPDTLPACDPVPPGYRDSAGCEP